MKKLFLLTLMLGLLANKPAAASSFNLPLECYLKWGSENATLKIESYSVDAPQGPAWETVGILTAYQFSVLPGIPLWEDKYSVKEITHHSGHDILVLDWTKGSSIGDHEHLFVRKLLIKVSETGPDKLGNFKKYYRVGTVSWEGNMPAKETITWNPLLCKKGPF